MGGATTQLVTSGVRSGGTVLIYGALSGPTLTLNTFDIFLRKRLEVPCSPAVAECRAGPLHAGHVRARRPLHLRLSLQGLHACAAAGSLRGSGRLRLAGMSACETADCLCSRAFAFLGRIGKGAALHGSASCQKTERVRATVCSLHGAAYSQFNTKP